MYGVTAFGIKTFGEERERTYPFSKKFFVRSAIHMEASKEFDVVFALTEDVSAELVADWQIRNYGETVLIMSNVMGGVFNKEFNLVNDSIGVVTSSLSMPYTQEGFASNELEISYNLVLAFETTFSLISHITVETSTTFDVVCSIDENSSMIVEQNKTVSVPNTRTYTLE